MANQERPGGGRPEIDHPDTPHPQQKDREIQSPPPRTTPTDDRKQRTNRKTQGDGQGKPSRNQPTTP